MKTTAKIFILALSIILAVAAVMVYAKTRVEPPMALKQKDQYARDLKASVATLGKADNSYQEDSVFATVADRIAFFATQDKISADEADKNNDALLEKYVPLFLKRSFDKFLLPNWNDTDHNYMLSTIASIKSVKHTNGSMALSLVDTDSLTLIESVIGRYRKARILAKHTGFNGVANAQSVISQANQYINDPWLSHCTSLVSDLKAVKPNIAQSHYYYIVRQVQKMSQYRYYSQDYYDNSIVPLVDAAISEYENKASALYGNRKNVDDLWARARNYYDEASDYYTKQNLLHQAKQSQHP